MARGRNSKAAVMRDTAREQKLREADAKILDQAILVIERKFTGEGELIEQLDYLCDQIRKGMVDYTDHLVR